MTTSFLYTYIIWWAVVYVIIVYFVAKILANLSEGRNISRETAFWILFILGPLIGMIVILASDKESIPSTNHKISKTRNDMVLNEWKKINGEGKINEYYAYLKREGISNPIKPFPSENHQRPMGNIEEMKTCPMCAEEVRTAAKICKHCKHEF
jgi:hypothetical protein